MLKEPQQMLKEPMQVLKEPMQTVKAACKQSSRTGLAAAKEGRRGSRRTADLTRTPLGGRNGPPPCFLKYLRNQSR